VWQAQTTQNYGRINASMGVAASPAALLADEMRRRPMMMLLLLLLPRALNF